MSTDAFLIHTAVKKYLIGIAEGHGDYKVHPHKRNGPAYPLMQINPVNGSRSLRCPSISGGRIMQKFDDIEFCNGQPLFTEKDELKMFSKVFSAYEMLTFLLIMEEMRINYVIYNRYGGRAVLKYSINSHILPLRNTYVRMVFEMIFYFLS